MSAVDEALAELKKAEEALLAAKAVDASTLPKADVEEKVGEVADTAESVAPSTLSTTEVPVVVHSHEIKLGPTDVHGA